MTFYHGSMTGGLTELKPFSSAYNNLTEPLVYMTTSRQLALHYIWDIDRIGVKMPMLNIREDGVLVFQEMFSGALEYFYKGVSGYIYRCEGNYPINNSSGVHSCATSAAPVPVVDVEYVDDVYERILSFGQQGTFIYERFEELLQWRMDVIRGQIVRLIKRCDLLKDPSQPAARFVWEKFPLYWQEAQVLCDNALL